MVKLAVIKPNEYPIVGAINMALTHLLLGNGELKKRWRANSSYKILDNSAFELGESMDFEDVIQTAIDINADEIVLPDVFRDGKATLEATQAGIDLLKKKFPGVQPFKVMGVPQGKTLTEWSDCYSKMVQHPDIDVISINRDSAKYFGTRLELCQRLENSKLIFPNKEYHLLGMQDDILEIVELGKRFDWVRSVDSCFPYLIARDRVAGQLYKPVCEGINRSEHPTTINFADKYNTEIDETLRQVLAEIEELQNN